MLSLRLPAAQRVQAAVIHAVRPLHTTTTGVGRSLGAHQSAFLALGSGPGRFDESDLRAIARKLRQATAIYRLELECAVALHAGPRPVR